MEDINLLINPILKLVAIFAIFCIIITILAHNFGSENLYKKALRGTLQVILLLVALLILKVMSINLHNKAVGGFQKWGEQNIKNTSREIPRNTQPEPTYTQPKKKKKDDNWEVEVQVDRWEKPEKKSDYIYYQKGDEKTGRNKIVIEEAK